MVPNRLTKTGILNVDKPAGMTSFRVVATVRRLSGERRVGHAGTLDPDATGVLPICIGQATRITEFLVTATKEYRAEIEFGVTTDTYDRSGQVTDRGDISRISREDAAQALDDFRGAIEQTPPMYSAKKHGGRRLYELARQGIEVERPRQTVVIHELAMINWQPPLLTIRVVCSKGTYIRSLAHDLGTRLGCGACLNSLVRTRVGIFGIEEAVPLDRLEAGGQEADWSPWLHPLDSVLTDWPAVTVSDAQREQIRNGQPLMLENSPDEAAECRAYGLDGRFIGVLRFNAARKLWAPV